MRLLVNLSPGDTVSSALTRAFSDANQEEDQCVVQISECDFIPCSGVRADRLELGSLQLWLSAMRHFNEISPPPRTKQTALLARPRMLTNETTVSEFAALAFRLGFISDSIQKLISQSPDRELARTSLMQARPPEQYEYDPVTFEHFIQQMVAFYAAARKKTRLETETVNTERTTGLPLPKRCGIPEASWHRIDVSSLYLNKIGGAGDIGGGNISSFFVRKSVYLAFFGDPSTSVQHVVAQLENSNN